MSSEHRVRWTVRAGAALLRLLASTWRMRSHDAEPLHEARTLCSRRGVVILLSDLFAPDAAADRVLANTLADWQAAGHDVLVIHLMDPVETKLPAHGKYVTRDLESANSLRTDASTLHEIYEQIVSRWRTERRSAGESSGLDWLSVTTADSIADPLAAVLARRALMTR